MTTNSFFNLIFQLHVIYETIRTANIDNNLINNYSNKSVHFSPRDPHSGNAIPVGAHTQRNEVVIAMKKRTKLRKVSIAQYVEKPFTVTKVDVGMREFIPEIQPLPLYQSKLV